MRSRASLTLRFAGIPALVLLVLTGLMYWGTTALVSQQMTEKSEVHVEQRALLLADRLTNAVQSCIRGIERLKRFEGVTQSVKGASDVTEMNALQREQPSFVWVGFIDAKGTVVRATKGWLEGESVTDRPVFKNSLEQTSIADFHPAVLLAPYLRQLHPNEPVIVADIGTPLRDASGNFKGVVAGHIDESWLRNLADGTVSDREAQELGMSWYLITGSGQTLGRQPMPFQLPASPTGKQTLVTGENGHKYMVSVRPMGDDGSLLQTLGWRVAVASDLDVALEPLTQIKRTLALFALLCGGLFALGGFVLAKRTTLPLDRFFGVIRRRFEASGGPQSQDYSEYLAVLANELAADSSDELGNSGEMLRRMAHDASQLKRVIDNFPMAISISSSAFRVDYVNKAYTRLLGYEVDDVRGRRTAEYLFEALPREEYLQQLARLGPAPGPFSFRFEALCKDGSKTPVQSELVPLYDKAGNFTGVLGVAHDLSSEALHSQRARSLTSRLHLLANAAVDYAFIGLDSEGRVLSWSEGAHELLKLSADSARGRQFETLFAEEDRFFGLPAQLLEKARSGGQVLHDHTVVRGDGTRFMGQGRLYFLKNNIDGYTFAFVLRDKTAEHEALRLLARNEQELALLTHRLLEQEKQTTRMLAQALHDDLGQTLGAMRLLFDAGCGSAGTELPTWVQRLGGLITDANLQVRRVLTDLRPPLLDEQGLLRALENELQQRRVLADGVRLDLVLSNTSYSQRWDPAVEYATFMVAREAVTNALKHANPTKITVEVAGDDLSLLLKVTDDGAQGLVPSPKPGHLGLVGMRERAMAIHASLSIQSSVGIGTTVLLSWEAHDEPTISN
jgi:PAS domain S-box-containing protein